MPQQWAACPVGTDQAELARTASRAHEEFCTTGGTTEVVRTPIAASWRRCTAGGLDPARPAPPPVLGQDELARRRDEHPFAAVLPVVRELLVRDARELGVVVALADVDGTLLWVEGDRTTRTRAEAMRFVAGACWSESAAGTNAPGTALALDRPMQVFAAEHLADSAAAWSCTAVPVHDPVTGRLIGALDLTGDHRVAAPHVLPLVRAAVCTVESQLRLLEMRAGWSPRRTEPRLLEVLGRRSGVVRRGAADLRLGLRHSEVLALLAAAPDGLSAEELGAALHGRPVQAGTVRAEVSRLRTLLPDVPLRSAPYRTGGRLETDAQRVVRLLAAGRTAEAARAYPGPLLPRSEAPGIERLRTDLHRALRASVLRSRDADLVLRFLDTEHSRRDLAGWQQALTLLPASSPRVVDVRNRVERLDAELR